MSRNIHSNIRQFAAILLFLIFGQLHAQTLLHGRVTDEVGRPLPFANVWFQGSSAGAITAENGSFSFESELDNDANILVSYVGYLTASRLVSKTSSEDVELNFILTASPELEEVVITGTLSEMTRKESPVPVEVYHPSFFKKNPSPTLFESLNNVNGVRPQLNCNVCNTGDIHINGLEGAYTMVMIDGMPIVSGLSTVYGLMGIPNSMIERVEIIKGPASSLYGSEAIGGLVNVITKMPASHARFNAEIMTTSYNEHQIDLAFRAKAAKNSDVLTGMHLFKYDSPVDQNQDHFTDITLSDRFSVFQKWNIYRKDHRLFTIGGRYYYEDRWGGEMNWNPEFRGGDSVYGESIQTNRIELFSNYQLPVKEKMMLWFSINHHDQNSYYGTLPFMAKQSIGFSQITWDKTVGRNNLTSGLSSRFTYYDDNTTATGDSIDNKADQVFLPGIFIQDDFILNESSRILLGIRYDHHPAHGAIFTPRMAYKWSINDRNSIRINAGTGFRVVNIFTEDHAALTGARDVIINEDLDPERSVNFNLNYLKKIYTDNGNYWAFDFSVFHSRFSNKIIADYDADPNLIFYQNLQGYAISQGFSVNADAVLFRNLRAMLGITFTDVYSKQKNEFDQWQKIKPVLTETWSSTWSLSYTFAKYRLVVDYTGTLYSPMRLPLLGATDPRAEFSPWWSLQNIQFSHITKNKKWEFFTGIKNFLNFLPPSNSIARSFDPFDKKVSYDVDGNVLATSENPNAMTFDPSYVFAPNQGRRYFIGLRYHLF